MSKLYIQESSEPELEELEEKNTTNNMSAFHNEVSAENFFMKKIAENNIQQKSLSIKEKIEQYLLNYGNERYNNQTLYNSFQSEEDKMNMFWKFFGALLFVSIASTAVHKNIEVTRNIKTSAYVNTQDKNTVYDNIILDSLNYSIVADIKQLKSNLEKSLTTNSPYLISIIKNKYITGMGENDSLQLIPKGQGSTVNISYSSLMSIDDMVSLSFAGLNSSEQGKLEKSILISKLTERNYPGYNISIRMKNDDEMDVTFTKKASISILPKVKEEIILPMPIPTLPPLPQSNQPNHIEALDYNSLDKLVKPKKDESIEKLPKSIPQENIFIGKGKPSNLSSDLSASNNLIFNEKVK